MWNRSENQITLVLIRHGATASNKEHRYLGKTDEGLSKEGIEELRRCVDIYPQIDYLFTSPMKRCLETAKLIFPDKKPITIPGWREMDFGAFEGKNYFDLQDDERYQAWIDSNGTLPFPEGECREDFIKRCVNGFYEMLEQLKDIENQEISVGIVVHGGTIMSLLSSFYGGDYFDYQVANGKGYVCRVVYNDDCIRFDSLEKLLG